MSPHRYCPDCNCNVLEGVDRHQRWCPTREAEEGLQSVYIVGPMTGVPAYNADVFAFAQGHWQRGGWAAQTPLDADNIVWQRAHGRPFNPYTDRCEHGDPLMREMTLEGLRLMSASDAVAILPGWKKSKGTVPEVLIAQNWGMSLYDAETMLPIGKVDTYVL